MYRVTVLTDGKEYELHEPRDPEGALQLISPSLKLEMGKTGTFTFRIPPTHPNKGKIQAIKSEVLVYDDNSLLYAGRPMGNESDFYNIGEVNCEGELAYLLDSIQRPFHYTGSFSALFRQMLDVHNSQVEERKRFTPGIVTVTDTEPEVVRDNKDCKNTLEMMRAQLVKTNGGHLRVRRDGGRKYLDYVIDYGGINSQVIRFGENLLDLTRYLKPTGIITALIPYGETIETENTDEEDKPLDIKGVNGGLDYIFDQAAVDAYGWIWGTQTFNDVTDPVALLSKARAYLTESIVLPETLELTALDLGLVDVDIQKLQLGYWTQVESVPHGISRRLLLTKREIYLDNPAKDKVILGQTLPTFTGSSNKNQNQISDKIDRVAASTSREINRKVENATKLITGGLGGYVVLDNIDPDTGEKTHPWRILIMNTPDKETAKNVIQFNQNGIGFSTTGISGPYDNAWTIDGNLVADFITTGTMLADRVRGGTMELGGSGLGRDGSILIRDTSDRIIGSFDKNGIVINGGKMELGGSGIAKDGSIVVKDANNNLIGSWDKTGLTILKGILQGVSAIFGGVDNQNGAIEVRDATGKQIGRWDKDGLYINKGAIEGGTINIGQGTFRVDRDGSVNIESGEINIGPVTINDNMLEMGVFRLASSNVGVFYSKDKNIEIWTNHPDWGFATIFVGNGEGDTKITKNAVNSKNINVKNDISISSLVDETGWEPKWMSIKKNIIELWDRIESIENSIQS